MGSASHRAEGSGFALGAVGHPGMSPPFPQEPTEPAASTSVPRATAKLVAASCCGQTATQALGTWPLHLSAPRTQTLLPQLPLVLRELPFCCLLR